MEDLDPDLWQFPQQRVAGLPRARSAALRAPVSPALVPVEQVQPAAGVQRQGVGYPVPVHQSFRDCSECPEMVVIPAGSFMMGSPANEKGRSRDEGPQRLVTLREPIALGRFPVTVREFRTFVEATGYQVKGCTSFLGLKLAMAAHFLPSPWDFLRSLEGRFSLNELPNISWRSPGFPQDDDHPVVCVSKNDAEAYVRWLSERTGQVYRLPTEAEWEYAARAGTNTTYVWGEREADQCRYANLGDQSGFRALLQAFRLAGVERFEALFRRTYSHWASCDDGFGFTSPVGHFPANPFGLHDMIGNVWQIVADCWYEYRGASLDASHIHTKHCGDFSWRRGGSWDTPRAVRVAFRAPFVPPASRYPDTGFRVARLPSKS